MNRTDRLYAVTEELRAAGTAGRTAAWLAARLEVSTRTVKRDVSALQQSGVPVYAQGGPGGGYVLLPHASLPPLNVTAAEATAIALALHRQAALPFAADGRSALRKILAVMPPGERAAVDDLAARLWLRWDAVPPRPRVASVLDEAVRRCVVTRLDYRGGDGTRTTRYVEPAALAETRGHWYLLAWCRLRQGPRWFRLDRVASAYLTAEPAPRHDPATEWGTPPPDAAPVAL